MIFEKEYEIKYYEMNLISGLKESSFLLFLQDAATQSAESLGFGPDFIFKNNYAWFLLKYRVEFEKYPVGLDRIKIITEPRGGVKLFAHREFKVTTVEDEPIARVNSIWTLVDFVNKKMLPITTAVPHFPVFQKREDDLEFPKIPPLQSENAKCEIDISFDDIDINQHANNANYIRWALEPLDKDFRLKNVIKTMDMNFKKEIAHPARVQSIVEINGDTTNHIVKNLNTGDELCTILIKWENDDRLSNTIR